MAKSARLLLASTVAVIALGITGCTGEPEEPPLATVPIIQPGAPGEPNRTLSPEEYAASTGAPYVEADVAFLRDMLHHHSQALTMTSYVEERTKNEDIRLLAGRMDLSQTSEMELMENWLRDRGEPVRDPDGNHGEHNAQMPGLLTDAELAQLEGARDAAFDKLFLQLMTKHHEGAITMVNTLRDAGAGQETELDVMATHIHADQNIEIERMAEMLAAMR